ncbi:MAG: ABC transporter ATP-binding protein [Bacteroidales bacterium]
MVNIENLSFSYGRKRVLSNISLSLERGKMYGLLGENGVGKTTLFKILSGLQRATAGSCTILNESPFKRAPSLLGELFYLPEELNFVKREQSIASFAKGNGALYPNWNSEKFYEILDRFSLNPKERFGGLSYGQAKKGVIAFALATNVSLLLLDEPTNGLDIPSKGLLRAILSEYSLEDSSTIIATHQVRDLENLIDPIIILDNCSTLLNNSLEEISKKIRFSIESLIPHDALYYEAVPGGYLTVRKNSEGVESRVDLEALFNVTINNRELIKELFKE